MELNHGYGFYDESAPIINKEIENKQSFRNLKTFLITMALILFSVFAYSYSGLINTIKPSSFKLMISNKPKSSSGTVTFSEPWETEKNTISITSGTYQTVSDFVNKYITNINEIKSLGGCDTYKVVGKCLGGYELHFLDSSTFTQSGLTIGEWSKHIESLGIDKFNDFMHNKQQLFVPDLSPHYNTLIVDNIDITKRLSKSSGSKSLDLAHIGIPLYDAQTIFEIIGPSSSLSSDVLKDFQEFPDEECPIAQSLPFSLDYYIEQYNTQLKDPKYITNSMTSWSESTGMYVPLSIQTTVPTGSIDTVQNTLNLMSDITGATLTYASNSDGTCKTAMMNLLPTKNSFSAQIIYVENNANSDDYTPTVSDWEQQIAQSHTDLLDGGNGWDRYLDTHLGYVINDPSECDDIFDFVENTLSENEGHFTYSLRVTTTSGIGSHYYTGTAGIKSWEINVGGCAKTTASIPITDICGCLPSNNNVQYMEQEGYECSTYSYELFYEE